MFLRAMLMSVFIVGAMLGSTRANAQTMEFTEKPSSVIAA